MIGHITVIPVFGRLRQEDGELEVSLGSITRLCLKKDKTIFNGILVNLCFLLNKEKIQWSSMPLHSYKKYKQTIYL
jgi:hypothetical protein